MLSINEIAALPARWPFLAILKKDLLQRFRGGRLFFWVGLAAAVGCLLVLLQWPREGFYLSQGAWASRAISGIIPGLWFCCCILFVPAYSAASIVAERESRTYGDISLTLVSEKGFVAAKALGSVVPLFLAVIASLPLFGAAFFLAGVDWREFLWALWSVLSTASLCCGAGLFCSVRSRNSGTAIAIAFLFAPVCLIGTYIVVFIFAAFGSVIVDEFNLPIPYWLTQVFIFTPSFLCGIGLMAISAREIQLRAYAPPSQQPSGISPEPHTASETPKRPESPRMANPFAVAERRRAAQGTQPGELEQGVSLAFAVLAIPIFIVPAAEHGLAACVRVLMVYLLIPAMLLPGPLMACFVSREVEQRAFDALRSTLLTPKALIFGKILGIARRCRSSLAIFATAILITLVLAFFTQKELLIAWPLSLLACIWVSAILGFAVSVRTRRSPTAIVATLVLLLIAGLMPQAAGFVLGWTLDSLAELVTPGSRPQLCYTLRDAGRLLSPTTGFYHNLYGLRGEKLILSHFITNFTACMLWSCALLWFSMRRLRRLWKQGTE